MDVVTATIRALDGPVRDADGWEHYPYRVTLHYQGRRMTTPYRTGTGWVRDDGARELPTVRDILECLLTDAAGVENARDSGEDWASDYGYDVDSRKAEAMFRATTTQTDRLARLLGDDYMSAVFPTSDDDAETVADRLAGEARVTS